MLRLRNNLLLLLTALLLATACKDEPPVTPDPLPADPKLYTPTVALKNAASFPVGMATQAARVAQTGHADLVKKEFNSITAEYEMKQNIFQRLPGSYDWGPADAIVNFAQANGMRVHGHALIWHSAVPNWVTNYAGTDAEFEVLIRDYIQAVVSRYKGKVASWDVVNEAFDDGTGAWRNTIFRQRLGDDYVARCFEWARAADPDVLLFYNDYGAEYDAAKRDAILAMIADFQARGIPIDGFGFQMHINYDWPSLSTLTTAVEALQATGLLIHFSELDIRVNPQDDLTALSEARAKAQEERYEEIATLYRTIPEDQQYGITVWGLQDNESWLLSFWGNPDWPLLFDANRQYKIAHRGFVAGM
ncbi:MAG: hypothetical protein OHK0039_39830 [Bacteroidia bacterium]